MDTIAQSYGIPAELLIFDNQLVYPYKLALGQALYIPTYGPAGERPQIQVSGYAYPYISPWCCGRLFLISQNFQFFLMDSHMKAS